MTLREEMSIKYKFDLRRISLPNYYYECEDHGEMILRLSMSEVKDEMDCPLCKKKVKRIYSPTPSVWYCSGSYNQTRGK